MFRDLFAKRKTKKFIISMSHMLVKGYGKSKEYTEGQVKTALSKLGYEKEFEEVAIGIFCNEKIAKEFGIEEALIKKYRGYPREHNIGIGTYGNDGGFSGDVGGSSD
jgi:hypothetical protein